MGEVYLNIKRIAKRKRILQKEIAEQLNVDENTISNYFRNKTKIPIDLIPDFAKILNVSINDLYGLKKTENQNYVEEPYSSDYSCPGCREKEERIIELTNEIYECQKKYIDCLELLKEKKSAAG